MKRNTFLQEQERAESEEAFREALGVYIGIVCGWPGKRTSYPAYSTQHLQTLIAGGAEILYLNKTPEGTRVFVHEVKFGNCVIGFSTSKPHDVKLPDPFGLSRLHA